MRSAARTLSLIYIGLTGLFLAYLGMIWAFSPADHMARLGITATDLAGVNTLKSVMATGLLGMTGCCALFLLDREKWCRPLALLTAIMLTVRVVSLAVDGVHLRMGIYAVLEVLILVAVATAVRLEPSAST